MHKPRINRNSEFKNATFGSNTKQSNQAIMRAQKESALAEVGFSPLHLYILKHSEMKVQMGLANKWKSVNLSLHIF